MTCLPEGWARSTLVEVCERVQDCEHRTPKYSDDGIPALRPRDVVGGHLNLAGTARVSEDEYHLQTRRYAPASGDVVYSRELSLGWAATVPATRLCLSQGMVAITPGETMLSDFLVYFLNGPGREHALASQAGSAHPHLNLRDVRGMPIAVAPLAEQQRIVAAIEEAFSKLDAGEAALRTVRQLLKRMRDAILTAAVTGRLVPQDPADTPAPKLLADLGVESVEQDDASQVPDGWAPARMRDIAHVGSGTTPKRGRRDYWEGGTVPWVTSGAVTAGVIRQPSELVTEAALRETSLRLWPSGTLLVAMYGEGQTRGRCAELAIEATCNQACAAIALRSGLDAYRRLVHLHFDANYSANRRLASGGVQPNLSGALIKEMVVALPPPEEAERIVVEVDRQMSFVQACERAVEAGLERSTALRRSVLKAAFEGRLVPQDPTDEPASVLLERIRAERAAAPKAKSLRAKANS